MLMSDFRALVLREADRKVSAAFETLSEADLPEGDVLVQVSHSTVNYKDGMVMNGIGRLVRDYPHVPGIDFSGTVESSEDPDFKPGDEVILTGWRVGETHWGAYAEKARVKGDWLVPLPGALSMETAMAVGTAGFTAMMAVQALESHGIKPSDGEVLVTGASGGVGSVATAILANLGYDVAASTGRPEQADYLTGLGAKTIIDRAELAELPSRPLGRERFAGAIDNVGGATLSNLLTQISYGGSVAAVGLTGGSELSSTVLPFLLRGVNLLGIDSVMCPKTPRVETWRRVARDLPMDKLREMVEIHSLDDLPRLGAEILAGGVRGRAVIKVA
jgi:acrylyl-CoA reductase (NADPH)